MGVLVWLNRTSFCIVWMRSSTSMILQMTMTMSSVSVTVTVSVSVTVYWLLPLDLVGHCLPVFGGRYIAAIATH